MKITSITPLGAFLWTQAVTGANISPGGPNKCALRNTKLQNNPRLEDLLADCSSFVRNTVQPATVTTTKTSLVTTTTLTGTTTFTTSTFTTTVTPARKRGAPQGPYRIPLYAAGLCPDAAAYRSACACLGVTTRTTTTTTVGPTPTVTVLITSVATVTQTSTSTSTAVFTAIKNTCTVSGDRCDLGDPDACCSLTCCNSVSGPYCCG